MTRRDASRVTYRWSAVVLVVAMLMGRRVHAQTEFAQTLHWGSGLIDIPTAWVSPLSGDFSLNWSGTALQTSPSVPQYQNSLAGTGSVGVALFQHVEVGMSVLSKDFEHGFYGRVLLWNADNFRGRTGSFLPSLAIGMQNIGPYNHIDRFGLGYAQGFNPGGGTAPLIGVDSLHRTFSTAQHGLRSRHQELLVDGPALDVARRWHQPFTRVRQRPFHQSRVAADARLCGGRDRRPVLWHQDGFPADPQHAPVGDGRKQRLGLQRRHLLWRIAGFVRASR